MAAGPQSGTSVIMTFRGGDGDSGVQPVHLKAVL